MKTINTASQLAILSAASIITACSSSSDSNGLTTGTTGELSLSLFDAPVTDVDQINVEIDMIRIKPEEGSAIEFDFDPDLTVDLLALTPDDSELLLDGEVVPAGAYNWIELVANAEFDGVNDSYVRELAGAEVELRIPSGSVRLVSGFTVTADQETSFAVDWNARKGLVAPPGQPGYMLRPAFRVIDMTAFGTLSGTVAMSLITPGTEENGCDADSPEMNPDVGNVVYVFAGNGATADDIDGIDEEEDENVDPVATIEVAQEMADYAFSTILTPGDYTLAFTCQAGLDDPEEDDEILFSDTIDVTIVADEEEIVEFAAP